MREWHELRGRHPQPPGLHGIPEQPSQSGSDPSGCPHGPRHRQLDEESLDQGWRDRRDRELPEGRHDVNAESTLVRLPRPHRHLPLARLPKLVGQLAHRDATRSGSDELPRVQEPLLLDLPPDGIAATIESPIGHHTTAVLHLHAPLPVWTLDDRAGSFCDSNHASRSFGVQKQRLPILIAGANRPWYRRWFSVPTLMWHHSAASPGVKRTGGWESVLSSIRLTSLWRPTSTYWAA